MSATEILKRVWGYDSLRPLQAEVIEAALGGRDAVVVMPTGGGKSLCFQVPPLLAGGLTVVVSPLISLMKDQVDGLKLVGYPAEALHSNLAEAESASVRRRVGSGEIKLLYTSPERVLTAGMLELLRQSGVARIAIDEAHCISQWGHDFRPEYRQLSRLRTIFPKAAIHALTATATPRVREDVARELCLRSPEIFVGVFDRPNLTYRIVPKFDPIRQIAQAIQRYPEDAAIVYCISRKDTERVANALLSSGVQAAAYHAGLDAGTRKEISEAFAQERVNVVVATVAFGMGIDRANVRCVIHESMPKSIEAYQQETGRAGRDGLPSECLMLYNPNDYVRWERLIRESSAPDQMVHQLELIDEVRRYAVGTKCRHAFLSEYFGQELSSDSGCDGCDLCLEGWQTVEHSSKRAHQVIATVIALQEKHGTFGFGARHVAEILAGANTKNIRKHGHEQLKAYGAVRGISADRIGTWVSQLVDLELLKRTAGEHPTLIVSNAGLEALRNRAEISLRDVALPAAKSKRSKSLPESFDEALFEALRLLRRRIALEREVPAYVIFHDSVLIALAGFRPTTAESLMRISGVGEKRAKDFGPAVLEVVRDHVASRGLTCDLAAPSFEESMPRSLTNSASSLRPLFEAGFSFEEMRKRTGLSFGMMANYLADWVAEVRPAGVEAWVDAFTYDRVARAVEQHGPLRLKPIFDALEGAVSYEEIRVVVSHLEVSQSGVGVG